jgi:TPR repeat protein
MRLRGGIVALLTQVVACGGAAGAGAPGAPAYDADAKAQCKAGNPTPKPLVVEWSTTDRAELEALVHGKVVPVRYEGCKLEVLSSCKSAGQYQYTPVTPKEDHVKIKNTTDLYASMPVYGFTVAGKLASAGELNVNMTVAGRFETERTRVGVEDLEGNCAGATHFVRAFIVGAFDFYAGASDDLGVDLNVAGASAGARRSSQHQTLLKDGNAAACAKSTEADKGPPFGCGALLRLDLVPLGDAARSGDAPRAEGTLKNPYRADNARQLEAACGAQHGASCAALGYLYARGLGVAFDNTRALALFDRACTLKSADGCASLGDALDDIQETAKKQPTKALEATRWGCEHDSQDGCWQLAQRYKKGDGVDADLKRYEALLAKSFSLAKAACDGGDASACLTVGSYYLKGEGAPPNKERAAFLIRASCQAGFAQACESYGLLAGNHQIDERPEGMYEWMKKGCDLGDAVSCYAFANSSRRASNYPNGKKEASVAWAMACDKGIPGACSQLGLEYAHSDPARAALHNKRACSLGDQSACDETALARLPKLLTLPGELPFFSGNDLPSRGQTDWLKERPDDVRIEGELAALDAPRGQFAAEQSAKLAGLRGTYVAATLVLRDRGQSEARITVLSKRALSCAPARARVIGRWVEFGGAHWRAALIRATSFECVTD